MKKIALLLTIFIIATAAFAAPAKKTVSAAPSVASAPAPEAGSTAIMAVTLNTSGLPSVKLGMGSWNLDVGGCIDSPASGRTDVYLDVKGEIPMASYGSDVKTYWVPGIRIQSVANATSIIGSLNLRGEYFFAPHLSIFGDLTAITITSAAGATTWTIINNGALLYSGVRLYM